MAARQTRQAEVGVTEAETAPFLGPNSSLANGTNQTQPGATNGTSNTLDEPKTVVLQIGPRVGSGKD